MTLDECVEFALANAQKKRLLRELPEDLAALVVSLAASPELQEAEADVLAGKRGGEDDTPTVSIGHLLLPGRWVESVRQREFVCVTFRVFFSSQNQRRR